MDWQIERWMNEWINYWIGKLMNELTTMWIYGKMYEWMLKTHCEQNIGQVIRYMKEWVASWYRMNN